MTTVIPPSELTSLVSGLAFPEGPRWHEGHLWCSDIASGEILTVEPLGRVTVFADGLGSPSGLGWLPDGRLLVAEGGSRRLLRREGAGWHVHADLSRMIPAPCNDMVVDSSGRAYVGNWGFDFIEGEAPAPTVLVRVLPTGASDVVATDMMFPNGSVITPDGKTLLVAETWAARVCAFEIGADGSLSGRKTWASFKDVRPDGMCLDEAGALWIASPPTREVVRALLGGEITHRIATPADALACMLGGPDRRTLFLLSSALFTEAGGKRRFSTQAEMRAARAGRIDSVRVECAGAGLP